MDGRRIEYTTSSDAETIAIAKKLALSTERGTVLALFGDLGSGKTTFVKGVASAFNLSEDRVTSPTFSRLHLYEDKVAHFDLYQLSHGDEFFFCGFDEYLSFPLTCIEWPELILPFLNEKKRIDVTLNHSRKGRKIRIEWLTQRPESFI